MESSVNLEVDQSYTFDCPSNSLLEQKLLEVGLLPSLFPYQTLSIKGVVSYNKFIAGC